MRWGSCEEAAKGRGERGNVQQRREGNDFGGCSKGGYKCTWMCVKEDSGGARGWCKEEAMYSPTDVMRNKKGNGGKKPCVCVWCVDDVQKIDDGCKDRRWWEYARREQERKKKREGGRDAAGSRSPLPLHCIASFHPCHPSRHHHHPQSRPNNNFNSFPIAPIVIRSHPPPHPHRRRPPPRCRARDSPPPPRCAAGRRSRTPPGVLCCAVVWLIGGGVVVGLWWVSG